MLPVRSLDPCLVKFNAVTATIRRYVSPILVDSMLTKAMAGRVGLLTDADLEAVVEQCMVGLRLFVDASRLPDLMLELADILTENSHEQSPDIPTRRRSSTTLPRQRTGSSDAAPSGAPSRNGGARGGHR